MAAPTCTITAHVVDINGVVPSGGTSFVFWLAQPFDNTSGGNIVPKQTVSGTASASFVIDAALVSTLLAGGSNAYLTMGYTGYPANTAYMIALVLSGYTETTKIAGTIHVDETGVDVPFTADLAGSGSSYQANTWMGAIIYRQTGGVISATGTATANTYAQFITGRYLPAVNAAVGSTPAQPVNFPLIDVSVMGDLDLQNASAIGQVFRKLGRNTIVVPNQGGGQFRFYRPTYRQRLQAAGIPYIGRNVFLIPGDGSQYEAAQSGDEPPTDAGIAAFAQRLTDDITGGGWTAAEAKVVIVSDERSWYASDRIQGWGALPSRYTDAIGVNTYKDGTPNATGLAMFRAYLQTVRDSSGTLVSPSYFGASAWTDLVAVGREKKTGTLAERRLYFHSSEFFWRHITSTYAKVTAALRDPSRLGSTLNTGPNQNNLQARSYTPGLPYPVRSQDAAFDALPNNGLISLDWAQFGADNGGDIHVEDFGPDFFGWTVAITTAKARAGADRTGNHPGTYCGPAYSGDISGAHQKKILAALAEGCKSFYFYAFGPAWANNADGYSERALTLPDAFTGGAEAARLIAAAETLLWPGTKRKAQVAILHPRMTQPWDPDSQTTSAGPWIMDGANPNLFTQTTDYMADCNAIFLALMHQAVPVDWLDEESLTAAGLAGYKVLYLTAPNIPAEAHGAIQAWVNAGGVLVTTPGAGAYDKYNTANATVANLGGITPASYTRIILMNLFGTTSGDYVGPVGGNRYYTYDVGPDGSMRGSSTGGLTLAAFETGGAAAVARGAQGSGWRFHFNSPPGLAYLRTGQPSGGDTQFNLNYQTGVVNYLVTQPLLAGGVVKPFDTGTTMIQAGVLESAGGWAVVLVNWTNTPDGTRTRTVRPPFTPTSAVSAKQGPLTLTPDGAGGYTFPLNLDKTDVISLNASAAPPPATTESWGALPL